MFEHLHKHRWGYLALLMVTMMIVPIGELAYYYVRLRDLPPEETIAFPWIGSIMLVLAVWASLVLWHQWRKNLKEGK